jgi:hypothetical protein
MSLWSVPSSNWHVASGKRDRRWSAMRVSNWRRMYRLKASNCCWRMMSIGDSIHCPVSQQWLVWQDRSWLSTASVSLTSRGGVTLCPLGSQALSTFILPSPTPSTRAYFSHGRNLGRLRKAEETKAKLIWTGAGRGHASRWTRVLPSKRNSITSSSEFSPSVHQHSIGPNTVRNSAVTQVGRYALSTRGS